MENMEIISSENGRRTRIFRAPLFEDYAFAKAPFQEYRRGMEMIDFDSLEVQNLNVVADYALYWVDRDFWELKGNVRVTSADGRILTTQQLNWDRKIKKIYSNVDSKVEDNDGSMSIGEGFEANDDFSEWIWRAITAVNIRITAIYRASGAAQRTMECVPACPPDGTGRASVWNAAAAGSASVNSGAAVSGSGTYPGTGSGSCTAGRSRSTSDEKEGKPACPASIETREKTALSTGMHSRNIRLAV